MGSFILMDPLTNATVAAGMIAGLSEGVSGPVSGHSRSAVSAHDRKERFGHGSGAIWVEGDDEVAESIERELFDQGCNVYLVRAASFNSIELKAVARAFTVAGVIGLFAASEYPTSVRDEVREIFGKTRFLHLAPGTDEANTAQVQKKLQEWQQTQAVQRGPA
jgi:adenylylsulfate kinase-like enzyme